MARITFHGRKRAKQRMGLQKKAVERTVNRVLLSGKRRTDIGGAFRKYLDHLFEKGKLYGTHADVIVYGNNIFLVSGEYLITTWPTPRRYRKDGVRQIREEDDW